VAIAPEGKLVEKGDLLVLFDSAPFQEQIRRNEALLAQAEADLEQARQDLKLQAIKNEEEYRLAARLPVAAGRFLTDLDVSDAKRSAVIGAWVARRLFPLGDPLGEWIRLGEDWFQVVGVLEDRAPAKRKGGPIRTRDVNQSVFIPLPALSWGSVQEPEGIDEIVMRVTEGRHVVASAEVAKSVLTRTAGAETFDVVVPREILRQRQRTQRIFNVVTGAIAAISLLVGGIGIMNIMLASVAPPSRARPHPPVRSG
jgi:putative ABC transport system permease protein